jgi:hypothetical protein
MSLMRVYIYFSQYNIIGVYERLEPIALMFNGKYFTAFTWSSLLSPLSCSGLSFIFPSKQSAKGFVEAIDETDKVNIQKIIIE